MKIKYAAKTKIALTAQEWELIPQIGSVDAAKELNNELSKAINEAWEMIYYGKNYNESIGHIQTSFDIVLNKYENFGATKPETKQVYSFMVEKLFDPYLVNFLVKKHPEYINEKKVLNV